MSTNPFEALMTPARLQAQREAEFNQIKKERGLNVGASMIADAGFQLRNHLRDKGYGLTPEDKRAAMTQGILQATQQSVAQMVADGEVDPMDAQDFALSKAIGEFMAMGDYEAAQSLVPTLSALRQQRGELAKLGAQTFKEEAAGTKYMSDADLAQYRKGEIDANVLLREANARAADARAEMYGRMPAAVKTGTAAAPDGTKLRDILTPSGRKELIDGLANSASFYGKIGGLYDIVVTNPAVLSAPGGVQASIQSWMSGLQEWTKSLGTSPGVISDPLDKAVYEKNAKRIAQTAKSLGMGENVARFNSLVIDLAFSLARANDPGGRLSNNDFDYSLQMLGAVQNPAAALATFQQVAKYVHDKNVHRRKADPQVTQFFLPNYAYLDDEYAKLSARWGGQQPQQAEESDEAILNRFLKPQGTQ